MRILIVNRNYFVTGGPEKYMFSLMESLPQHEFIPFSVDFEKNLPTPYANYFVQPPAGKDSVYYDRKNDRLINKLAYAGKSLYSFEARRKLESLIRDTRPQVALFLNAVYFSDSIIDACRRFNVPIIWRMSDFHKVCASYLLYRDGAICEECLDQGIHRALRHRCGGYQHSLGAALVKVAGMWLSRYRKSYEHVSYFITPSRFTGEKMIQGGFAPEKIVHLPTFVELDAGESPEAHASQGVLFVGRLSREKGVERLIDAFGRLRNREATLTIAGDTSGEYARQLMNEVPEQLRSRVVFTGFQDREGLSRLFREHQVLVVPSEWYENQPNVVLEGMGHGRPVIVPRQGSFMEIVKEGETGCLFTPGSPAELADKIDMLLQDPAAAVLMGRRAREYVREHHARSVHVAALEELFRKCRP